MAPPSDRTTSGRITAVAVAVAGVVAVGPASVVVAVAVASVASVVVASAAASFTAASFTVAVLVAFAVAFAVLVASAVASASGGVRGSGRGGVRAVPGGLRAGLAGLAGWGGSREGDGVRAGAGWRLMRVAARLMPPAVGARWLAEAEGYLAEALPAQRRGAVGSYLAGAPSVVVLGWVGAAARLAGRAGRGPAAW